MTRRSPRAGLSFPEVLATLALTAGLAVALYPALRAARQASRTTLCAENLRCLSRAMFLYAHDHDDTYPITQKPRTGFCCWHVGLYTDTLDRYITNEALWIWGSELGPNVTRRAAFICPADPVRGDLRTRYGAETPVPFGQQRTSYRLVRCLSVDDQAVNEGRTWPLRAHRLSDVRYPSQKIIAVEHDSFHDPAPWGGLTVAPEGHPYNALFGDHHVQYVSYRDILPSTVQDLPGVEIHDPNYTVDGMAGRDVR